MLSEDEEMLRELGIRGVDDLFSDIPREILIDGLDIGEPMSEMQLRREILSILSKNKTANEMPCFLGAGVYHHYIPSAVFELLSRSEFYSSYTPYQPELSQGMLQALFEYQSFVCELTGMDASNSSMYDASTALGEACLMSFRINRKKKILVPRAMHWEKKSVLNNYAKGPGLEITEYEYDMVSGGADLSDLENKMDDQVSAVYLESPNFLGVFERISEIRGITDGAILIVGANPLSLAVAEAPGNMGADIVVGEGQVLGNPMNYGGPLVGIFACRKEYIRKMPGRVIAATNDSSGRRAFTMVLQTREQHIRREKATSNICTNESLGSVAFAIHVALLGRDGLRKLANENIEKASTLASMINSVEGFQAPLFSRQHFNEFVVRSKLDAMEVNRRLMEKGIQGGLPLSGSLPELSDCSLYCTTEMHTTEDYVSLIHAMEDLV